MHRQLDMASRRRRAGHLVRGAIHRYSHSSHTLGLRRRPKRLSNAAPLPIRIASALDAWPRWFPLVSPPLPGPVALSSHARPRCPLARPLVRHALWNGGAVRRRNQAIEGGSTSATVSLSWGAMAIDSHVLAN